MKEVRRNTSGTWDKMLRQLDDRRVADRRQGGQSLKMGFETACRKSCAVGGYVVAAAAGEGTHPQVEEILYLIRTCCRGAGRNIAPYAGWCGWAAYFATCPHKGRYLSKESGLSPNSAYSLSGRLILMAPVERRIPMLCRGPWQII
jgi:hypothetical protein